MTSFDNYPKSVKKALRYIKQDAHLSQLKNLEEIFLQSINLRKKALENKTDFSHLGTNKH
ncbi:hypothetical protein [Priestia filamentosa]|uniref:hypothetical protein n=1 Tax=Priestia filamentosa TaxID=1402861 RepID=UPI000A084991|nr:hypothetical protein [Priestia filamentosa]MDT3763940.1 hypothetical protein [Priestia filamentosa]OXS71584.1 hypothetical protein B1B01_04495 [Priestia filamentosa]WRU94349.1 hypothetical protein RYX51_15170 [Priestia filamentosa]SMF11061.1 hypothetical protein SAMN06296056_101918 [Priestia filamentosa]